ncbi:MAG: extracellular solute-binding protein [Anaerolineaceae bacterium]|nr:extracellular solute-binding protein [Anaerolineaceae bacterium]
MDQHPSSPEKKSFEPLSKIILTIFLMLSVGFIFSACGLSGGGPTPTPEISPTFTPQPSATPTLIPTASPTPTPTPLPYLLTNADAIKGLTIQFWHPWTDESAAQVRALVNEFNQNNPYVIRVEVLSIGSSAALDSKLRPALEENARLPMLVAAPSSTLREWLAASPDLLIPLQDYYDHPEWGWEQSGLSAFAAAFLDEEKVDERLLSLPAQRNMPVLFYNQAWARELGFDQPPSTIEEFKTQSCTAAAAQMDDDNTANDGTGGWIIDNDRDTTLSWLNVFAFDSPARPVDAIETFNTKEAEAAFTYLWQLNNEGCAWTSRLPEPYDYFAARYALFYSGTLRDTLRQEHAMGTHQNTDEWTVIPYPLGMDTDQPTALIYGLSYAMLQGTPEEQLAAWFFLQWMNDSKNQAKMLVSAHTLPLSDETQRWLPVFTENHPQWQAPQTWLESARPMPVYNGWEITSQLLEDAAWQLYQPYTTRDDIPTMLEQLDAMTAEFTGQ